MKHRYHRASAVAALVAAAEQRAGAAALGRPVGTSWAQIRRRPRSKNDGTRRVPPADPWRHQSTRNSFPFLVESRLFESNNGSDSESEHLLSSPADPRDELAPPVFSLFRKSLLFDKSPNDSFDTNAAANEASAGSILLKELGEEASSLTLAVWSGAKAVLPPLLTGASTTDSGDKDAVGSLYNLMFVRAPTLCVGVGYVANLLQGHPLMMDPFGTGAFEVSPIIVFAALWAILRY